MDYSIVIGLEVHVQLLTETKMFCGCKTLFGQAPNSQTCPVCLGLPGSLPVMNRRAFELALRTALSLDCRIARFTKWDRKNYYYPDLPKNYQISQYDLPFAEGGGLEIDAPSGRRFIRLIRVHLEEDAGKNLHSESGGDSLVDLNRAGTPLLEIVSEPDLTTPAEARIYLETIRARLRDLEVSDCEMQEGSLRCDANVNLHIKRGDELFKTPIVEIKNMNSIKAVERALEYEAGRQYEEWEKTGRVLGQAPKQTRGWDDPRGVTRAQREKEEASDYRYFPEPDLMPVTVDDAWLSAVRRQIGENTEQRLARYKSEFKLSDYNASTLIAKGRAACDFFEELLKLGQDSKTAANWVLNDLLANSTGRIKTMSDFPIAPAALHQLISLVKSASVNLNDAREKILPAMIETGKEPRAIAKEQGLEVVVDQGAIGAMIDEVVVEMAKAVAEYKGGKEKALGAVVGKIMQKSKGKFPPALVNELLMKKLETMSS